MPAHKLAGKDFNQLWHDGIDVASGPFKFVSWQRGTQLVLARNTAFAAGPKAKVDRVVFRYIPSTPSLFQALNSGEIEVTEPQPQLQIVDLRKNARFKVQSGPGYFWEHLDIQTGPKGAPALKKKFVRQALITGINRAQIRQALYITPGLVPWHSTIVHEAAGQDSSYEAMFTAGKSVALVGLECLEDPQMIATAKSEWQQKVAARQG
jgi:peptide/nickel transport system substrate-binding protein